MIITHHGTAVNGIDVAKYQGVVSVPPVRPDWLSFFAFKATDSQKLSEGMVDPQFVNNRVAGNKLDVRWRPIYMYLRDPAEHGTIDEQFAVYCQTVGKIRPGECVMVDWEEYRVSLDDVLHLEELIRPIYGPSRWCMYVNDMTPDMTTWMETNLESVDPVPVIHPNYTPNGLTEAQNWGAAVWQVGVANRETCLDPFELYPQASGIDVDWVLKPDAMDQVCGRALC